MCIFNRYLHVQYIHHFLKHFFSESDGIECFIELGLRAYLTADTFRTSLRSSMTADAQFTLDPEEDILVDGMGGA